MRDVSKTAPITHVKSLDGDDERPGTFQALVSVFGNVDSDGDVVKRGAFAETLKAGPKPIVWSHDWFTPPIGETLSAEETDEGLLVKGRLFVDEGEDHAVARQVHAGLKTGALREFSWGGRVTKETRVENDDKSDVYELNEIDLTEYGPCLRGANPDTRLISAKSTVMLDGKDLHEAVRRVEADDDERKATSFIGELREFLDLPGDADRDTILAALRAAPAAPAAPTSPPVGETQQFDGDFPV